MSMMKKILPSLLASACFATLPFAAQASVLQGGADSLAQPRLAQATTSTTLQNLDEQPQSVEDLEVVEDLTDDQAAQITAIFNNYQPQIEAAMVDYLQALSVMNDLLVPSTASLALVDAHNNVVATEDALNNLYFQRNLAIREVLNPNQRQFINDALRAYLGIAPAQPVVVFPMNLVGQDSSSTIANLQADGWVVVFSTPGEVGLNRGSDKLNLEMNRSGEIIDAELVK